MKNNGRSVVIPHHRVSNLLCYYTHIVIYHAAGRSIQIYVRYVNAASCIYNIYIAIIIIYTQCTHIMSMEHKASSRKN